MSAINKLRISRLYTFFAAHKWLIFLSWSLWLTLEYFALGPYSYVRIHDWGNSILPMWMGSAQEFSEYGFSYWSAQAACGVDRLVAAGPLFRIDTALFLIFPGWLAVGLSAFLQLFIAGYFTYRLCKDCLRLGELPSLVAGLAYSMCFFYFQSGFAGEAGFPLILWSLERISQRKGIATYLFAALLGVFVLFSSSFALSIPFILVMALAWFVLVRRKYSIRLLSVYALFSLVILAGEIPTIQALLANSPVSHRADFDIFSSTLRTSWTNWDKQTFYHYPYVYQLIWISLGLGLLGLFLTRFRDWCLWMLLVLLGFCMSTVALRQLLLQHLDIGLLSGFQFDRFYLLVPFFATIIIGYVSYLLRQVWVFKDNPSKRMVYNAQAALSAIGIVLLLVCSLSIKNEHYNQWVGGARYAMLYENPELQLLASHEDSIPSRVGTIGPTPAYAWAYGLETVDGFVGLYPQRYQDFWEKVIEPLTSKDKRLYDDFHDWGSDVFLFVPSNGFDLSNIEEMPFLNYFNPNRTEEVPFSDYYNLNLLSLANTEYFVSNAPLKNESLSLLPSHTNEEVPKSILDRIKRNSHIYIYRNELCMPRFFVSDSAIVFDTRDELLQAMAQADIDTLRNSVFVEQEFAHDIDTSTLGLSQADIEVEQYSPDRIILSVKLDNPGILVASISYSPYWTCKVNGSEEKIFPAYHTFMGIFLAGNESEVEIEYHPPYRAFW